MDDASITQSLDDDDVSITRSLDDASITDASITDTMFTTNFEILQGIIKELEDQGARRSHNNIIDKFRLMNISVKLAEEIIDLALSKDLITSYKYSQQINYKVKSCARPTAIISDPVEDKGTSTEVHYVTSDEFNVFRNDILHSISKNQQQPIVETLLKHIEFLQNTITKLVESKNLPVCQHAIPMQISTPPSIPSQSNIKQQSPPTQLSNMPSITLTKPTPSKAAAPAMLSIETPPRAETAALASISQTAASPHKQNSNTRNNKKKKQVLIVGDSMLNAIDEKELRRDAFVRVRNHPGATIQDLIDHARAHTRNIKHDGVIIMAGTNDASLNNLEENKNKESRPTTTHLSELINDLKRTLPAQSHIAVCQITARKDSAKAMKDVHRMNAEFKLLAEREHIGYVNTSHFTARDHTGKKGVHPNDKGLDVLYTTLEKYVSKISRL